MAIDPATAQMIVNMIPVVTELAANMVNIANRLKEEGIEIPTVDQLRATNDALRTLPDLK